MSRAGEVTGGQLAIPFDSCVEQVNARGVTRLVRVHKRQRQTAREVYRVIRDEDKVKKAAGHEDREAQVLRCLAAFWNRHQASPTARELFAWATQQGERLDDINSVRPRLCALADAGIVEASAKRRCSVSGKTVHTWRVREIGS